MKNNLGHIIKLLGKQKNHILYVLFWSIGLFAATFYCFIGEFSFGEMKTVTAIDLANDYLFPLFMAMALFLLDAMHEMKCNGKQLTPSFLTCFILFVLATTFSIIVNDSKWGWVLFIASWLSLTALKAFTIIDVSGVIIDKN